MSGDIRQIAKGSLWRCIFVPVAAQRGELHRVLEIPATAEGDVISAGQAHIWRGPAPEFARQFRHVQDGPGPAADTAAA